MVALRTWGSYYWEDGYGYTSDGLAFVIVITAGHQFFSCLSIKRPELKRLEHYCPLSFSHPSIFQLDFVWHNPTHLFSPDPSDQPNRTPSLQPSSIAISTADIYSLQLSCSRFLCFSLLQQTPVSPDQIILLYLSLRPDAARQVTPSVSHLYALRGIAIFLSPLRLDSSQLRRHILDIRVALGISRWLLLCLFVLLRCLLILFVFLLT